MRRKYRLLLCMLVAVVLPAMHAWANLADYGFSATTGEYIDISDGTPILAAGADDEASSLTGIGFTFYFDGVPYNQFSVGSNGIISLGTKATACWVNQLTTPSGLCVGVSGYDYALANGPQIAPFWDDLRVADAAEDGFDGNVKYKVVGEAPYRVLVIDFTDIETAYYEYYYSTFQVRLYETTNRIEFLYDFLNTGYEFADGATIGIAASNTNFISVTPLEGGTASISTAKPNDYYYPYDPPIPSGTMYVFSPCEVLFTGNVAEGGTDPMAVGDTLLQGKSGLVGSTNVYFPFSMSIDGGCSTRVYVASISGPNASDFTIDPPNDFVTNEGITPAIYFTPSATGPRNAILTITDDLGRAYGFFLQAEGTSRIQWIGNIDQGGTAEMANKDVLMTNIHVRRNESGSFTPFTLFNGDENLEGAPAEITYEIKGISGGQYSIEPGSGSILPGESHTPTITFSPTGAGPILDSLIVTADGETRRFALLAFADAVGGHLIINDVRIDSTSTLFVNQFSCAGTGLITYQVQMVNLGSLPYQITKADFFLTDTTYGQGVPRYPLMRDEMGNPIRSYDYFITEQPPTVPLTPGQTVYPISVPANEMRTLYFTLVSSEPGKRFARAFLYTNSEAIVGFDPNGEPVEGLLSFDLFGRGLGGQLSDNQNGGFPKGVVFPVTPVGDSSEVTTTFYNTGTCDLRMANNSLRFTSGDIEEFRIIAPPQPGPGVFVDEVNGDLVMEPGASTSLTVRFVPSQRGSRRATIRLITNDSAVQYPGLTERGSYYLDFYGGGNAGLFASGIEFGTAVIGGTGADQLNSLVRLFNATSGPIEIASIIIEGTDAADFVQSAGTWPTTPYLMNGGTSIDLGVTFAPLAGGADGPRSAMLKVITADGDTIMAPLTGTAATRTINVNPSTINFTVSAGKPSRRTITITNTGTMPLRLEAPTLTGTGAADYTLGGLPRMELAPGQSEFLEITYRPSVIGTSPATLTIGSNATSGPVAVTLNGTATKTQVVEVDPSQSMPGRGIVTGDDGLTNRGSSSVSGVESESAARGMWLAQSTPNPARDVVEIRYRIAERAQVQLGLYDAAGRLVRVLDAGQRDGGEQSVRIDVTGLANGVYHYRLTAGNATLSRTMTIAR